MIPDADVKGRNSVSKSHIAVTIRWRNNVNFENVTKRSAFSVDGMIWQKLYSTIVSTCFFYIVVVCIICIFIVWKCWSIVSHKQEALEKWPPEQSFVITLQLRIQKKSFLKKPKNPWNPSIWWQWSKNGRLKLYFNTASQLRTSCLPNG